MERSFYRGKTIFITGHTGFKGSWLCKILTMQGARVVGYALTPPTNPSLFDILQLGSEMTSIIGDVRNLTELSNSMKQYQPEIVIHMAAQPLVRDSYNNPVYTYETNVMGTVNVCEAVRRCGSVRSFVNVTTDKVYRNNEWEWGYRESDVLDGYDPYSNSKSCSELVTSSYRKSFFNNDEIAVSTCRAGNVIGGGDFAKDRIIPDCVRAMLKGQEKIEIRNPYSVRPYQHVLEPLCAYLLIAQRQYENPQMAGSYNIGPEKSDCITTGALVDLFCKKWGGTAAWENKAPKDAPHEANFLKLDCSKAQATFGWQPKWGIDKAIDKTVEWSRGYMSGEDSNAILEKQIIEYLGEI